MYCHANLSGLKKQLMMVLLFLSLLPSLGQAKGVSDSILTIQRALPDSTALDGKVTYVDFWASWCLPCKQSFPWMQKLYEKYHEQGLEIVAVCVDKDHDSALRFLNENKSSFTVIFDSTGALAKQYQLKALPTSYLYRSNGYLVLEEMGFRQEVADSVEAHISQLLKKEEK